MRTLFCVIVAVKGALLAATCGPGSTTADFPEQSLTAVLHPHATKSLDRYLLDHLFHLRAKITRSPTYNRPSGSLV